MSETASNSEKTAAAPRGEALDSGTKSARDLEAAELAQVRELARIDREVRAHEAAHAAAGGALAGAPRYQLTRGPDGRLYATAGEVNIDTGRVNGDPEATLEKARTIIQAALAPANPSPQDLRVAAEAQAMMVAAQAELALQEAEEKAQANAEGEPSAGGRGADSAAEGPSRFEQGLAELADQRRALNERVNGVQQRLIDAGAVEMMRAEGAFLDLVV
ncbi:putative metalloprotease CJM1_0395 family protein [Motiliproteus sp. SC1-56]|uniref:putative metalloprotease CJM1_0395 family protein n=1 Tax=Motiliproteus sp. SC1-56 TaxID=2799565 RepID=UPI001A90B9A6